MKALVVYYSRTGHTKFVAEKIAHEKVEPLIHERLEPTLKSLDERLARIENSLKMGIGNVETFAKEKPGMVIGLALLGGIIVGVILGKRSE